MKRVFQACLCLALLSFLTFLFAMPVTPVHAGPAIPTIMKVTQPDGTVLQVRIRGDESRNWTELVPGGQTVVRNPATKVWEYAERAADGSLKPSGIRAEPGGKNAPPSVPKGLKPKLNPELKQRMPQKMEDPEAENLFWAPWAERKVLVVLVNFSDRQMATTPAEWYSRFFDTASGSKSVANFWGDNSYYNHAIVPAGHDQPDNPPGIMTATIPDPHPDYGGNVFLLPDAMIANQALAQLVPYIDFGSFDADASGTLEPTELSIYFIYAGYEASGTFKKPSVWAHAWKRAGTIMAGSEVVEYWGLNGELNDADRQHPVGVMAHEVGHSLFDLIDLYDPNGVNQALGAFSVMAAGSWGFDIGEEPGSTPTVLDVWSRTHNHWSYVTNGGPNHVYIAPSLWSETAGMLAMPFYEECCELPPSEYFLIENRQPFQGASSVYDWDRGLRGLLGEDWQGGLLILHVDDAVADNAYVEGSHQRVVPVQADTAFCDLMAPGTLCLGDRTTLFYAGNNGNWAADTRPDSNFYDGSKPGFSLTHITLPMQFMEADYSPDAIPPAVTSLAVPASSASLTVPVSVTATDNQKAVWYFLGESPVRPTSPYYDGGWQAQPPISFTFSGPGAQTLYVWVQDRAFNISEARSAQVTITTDMTPPTVTDFSIPATSSSLAVAITSLVATDDSGVTGYLVSESATKPSLTDAGWSEAKPQSYTFTTTGTKTLYAWARDAAGNISDSRSATVMIAEPLPSPWVANDVGSTAVPGSASYADGTFTLKGSGANIAGTADAFHFVFKPMTGNFEIATRLASIQDVNGWAKGGVMIRQSLDAGAINAMMAVTPENGVQFSNRTMTGGTTAAVTKPGAAPYWVKLVRQGSLVTGYASADAATWTRIGSATLNTTDLVYVGMAVTSHYNSVLCTATFDGVATALGDMTAPTLTAFTLPATSSSLTVPITALTATDDVGVTGYFVSESAAKPAAADPAWALTKPGSYTFATAGPKTLYAWAKDAAGNVSDSRSASVLTGEVLPPSWSSGDVGGTEVAGTTSYADGVFTLNGSGANIGGTADAFHYAYRQMAGNFQIVARLASLANVNDWAKAGVMIRQSLDAGSVNAMMAVTPASGVQFSNRTAAGGTTAAITKPGAAPCWVKLVRQGNVLTGYVSADAVSWVRVGSATVEMPDVVYAGMAVTSHYNAVLCTAIFDGATTALGDMTPPTMTTFTIPSTSSSLTVPITALVATDDVAVTGYLVNESAAKPAAADPGWSESKPASYTFPTSGPKTLYAWAKDAAGNVSESLSAAVTTGEVLPKPWGSTDIGSTVLSGTASYVDGVYTVEGAGGNIGGSADAFHFVYQQRIGNFQIVAKVASIEDVNGWAKAGVMIRQSLDANAMHAFMSITPENGIQFSRRTATGGATDATTKPGVAPYWVKLVREDSYITGYVSADGINWVKVTSVTINMTDPVYAGVAVTSHNTSALCTATFEGVGVIDMLPAPWETKDIGYTGLIGNANYANGVFTVEGAGLNITGTTDAFRYVYKPMQGDFQIVARINSLRKSNDWAKGGLMIRQSLDPNSMHAYMAVTPVNGVQFSYRKVAGGTTGGAALPGAIPLWLKLVREGNIMTGYISSDGVNWTMVGSATVRMTDQVFVGMAVCAHETGDWTAAKFDNVQ